MKPVDQNFTRTFCLILFSVATSVLIYELTLSKYSAHVVSMVALKSSYLYFGVSGLSMNILREGNKWPVQTSFFTNGEGFPRVSAQAV